jgi:hypothetical protein|tara:strand:- start:865 stop:2919 length:2055 start_codon:yes stop_codon:yes gene_type:complete
VSNKRKYNKKSEYWNKFKQVEGAQSGEASNLLNTLPETAGESFYIQEAIANSATVSTNRRVGYDGTTTSRRNIISKKPKSDKYTNIRNGLLPYDYSADGVNVRDAIELCQKAYANISIFRNAIDIMAEFSNSPIYLEGDNEKSKKFIDGWLKKINIWKIKDQYFREYYRSGNIFLYRVDGKFSSEDLLKLNYVYASQTLKPGQLPVKYMLLNPYDIVIEKATSFQDGIYKKVLSDYELEKLRDPKTEEDKKVFESLTPEMKKKVKEGSFNREGIKVELDSQKLIYSFYKKQDYEPFAVPFGFPVLDDLNWKIELKKIDQAICRTVENVILLITMGAEPDKGGVNPNNLKAMQELFKNESVGRALIADYTTKAQFVIPDLNKVLGAEKYKIVNEDIKEGLQNIIVGSEKFSNTQVKAEIFLERLKESRNAFLNDFLQPQIKEVCRNMGLKSYPTAKFEEIDIKDEVQFHRVITRLLEIGILTPEQGIKSMQTGLYPNPKDLSASQEGYVEEREKGYYNPLVGGIPMIESVQSEKDRELQEEQMEQQQEQITKTDETVNKTQQSPGRPGGTNQIPLQAAEEYGRDNVQEVIYKIQDLESYALENFKKHKKLKSIDDSQKQLIGQLCESIVCSKEKNQWKRTMLSCIKNTNKIAELSTINDILDISAKNELTQYPSAILYHSQKQQN